MIADAATDWKLTRTSAGACPAESAWSQGERSFVLACLAVIVVAGASIRLYPLSSRSLWFDEAFTWRLIDYPWLEMLDRATRDNSPPFYYFVLKGWSEVFGVAPVALRALSVLCGLLTILGTYVFCLEAFGRRWSAGAKADADDEPVRRARGIGLLAAGLVAVSALQIRYSVEVRMYALAAALSVFSGWALLRALRDGAGWGAWLGYAALAAVLPYTHYFGLYMLVGHAVFAVCFLLAKADWNLTVLLRRYPLWHALSAAALVFVAWLPWLGVFLRQQEQVRQSCWAGPVSGWQLADICYRMFAVPEFIPQPAHEDMLLVIVPCFAGLCLLALRAGPGEWLVLCSVLAPFVLCVLASWLGTQATTLRYFVMAQLFGVIGLAVLVFRIPYPLERTAAALAALGLFVLMSVESYQAMDLPRRPGARAAAAFLARERRPGEAIIVGSPLYYAALVYHGKKPTDLYVYNDGTPFPHYYGTAVLNPDEQIERDRLERLTAKRVWVVNMLSPYWETRTVPVPASWREKSTQTFPDLVGVGDFEVIEYVVEERPVREWP